MTSLQFPQYYRPTPAPCIIRVDDTWYDLSSWRHAHPGGAQIIDQFNGKDATEAFYALHSDEAIERLKRLKTVQGLETTPAPPLSASFAAFRKRLRDEGWFVRNRLIEAAQLAFILVLLVSGIALRHISPVAAMVLIGVGMQQAGWVSHDYAHMRGQECRVLTQICAVANGMSRGWWANKHNTHHVFPNRKELDSDIHNEPVLHLWFPPAESDVWYRRFQHIYYPIAYSFLLVSWRLQCLSFVFSSRDWVERLALALGYAWLAALPVQVALGSIFVAGFLMAIVVTANHQTEDIIETDDAYHFVRDQFRTTRGVVCGNPITEYLFGGMQYQLEHHLFPTLPRYYYPALRPLVCAFAKENGMQYHMSGVTEILKLNYDVMKRCAAERPAKPKTA